MKPPESERDRAELLESFAARRPLMLVLDDLHWADRSRLVLVRCLATRPQRAPLLVLASARDAERGPATRSRRRLPISTRQGEVADAVMALSPHGPVASRLFCQIKHDFDPTLAELLAASELTAAVA